MSTKRSLNKLERRSYMSIHNTHEVTDGKSFSGSIFQGPVFSLGFAGVEASAAGDEAGSSFTRDRFGKKHKVE